MSRWILLLALTLAGLAAVVFLPSSDDDDGTRPSTPRAQAPGCPNPRVTTVRAHPANSGYRVKLHVRADMERPGIGAFQVWWGDRSALVADGWWGRRAATQFEHHYARPGTRRITVVAEGSTKGCKRVLKSEPATLRVRIPLR